MATANPKRRARLPFWKRRLWFRLRYWWNPLTVATGAVGRWLNARHSATTIDGVRVLDFGELPSGANHDRFTAYLRDALFLIRFHDPVRYRRVVRHVRHFESAPCRTMAHFTPSTRTCVIDFNKEPLDDGGIIHPWYVAYFAGVIVHEATHGYLLDRFVPYTKANRVRVERICINQQNDFLTRLPKNPDDYVAAFANTMTEAELAESLTHAAQKVGRAVALRRIWGDLWQTFGKKPP